MKRSPRSITALAITVIYLLVSLTPLARAALHSGMIPLLLTAECTGDCRICGCSPERSAARACCCWQKRLAGEKARKQATVHNSCPVATAAANTPSGRDCCSKSSQHADHEDVVFSPTQANSTTDKETATLSISTCPCGSGKDLLFAAGEEIQHIPCRYVSRVPIQAVIELTFLQAELFVSRAGQPPDPPPKVSLFS